MPESISLSLFSFSLFCLSLSLSLCVDLNSISLFPSITLQNGQNLHGQPDAALAAREQQMGQWVENLAADEASSVPSEVGQRSPASRRRVRSRYSRILSERILSKNRGALLGSIIFVDDRSRATLSAGRNL